METSQNLVTIATFDQAAKARLAQNVLTEAGIRSAVADEATVSMDWLLGNAIGWIKLQVLENDADRAVAELERSFDEHGEEVGTTDPEELAREAEEAPADEDSPVEGALRSVPETTADEEQDPESPTEREQYAQRAFRAALFGLLVPLILFYALYLLQVVAFTEGRLDARASRRAWAAFAFTAFGLFAWWAWVMLMPSDFFDIL